MTKSTKPKRPSVVRETRRMGLKLYEVVTVTDAGSEEGRAALIAMLENGSFPKRLAALQARCKAYVDVRDVAKELGFIERFVNDKSKAMAMGFAMTALERGLDLLDTGRHLTALRRDMKMQVGRKTGAEHGNASRRKVPTHAVLLAELQKKIDAGYSEKDAKAGLRTRYGVTGQTLNAHLRKAKGA